MNAAEIRNDTAVLNTGVSEGIIRDDTSSDAARKIIKEKLTRQIRTSMANKSSLRFVIITSVQLTLYKIIMKRTRVSKN